LNHWPRSFFQLPVHHDTGLELLSDFKQSTSIHISDHIHEWRQCHRLCKEETTKEQHLDWFLKSLVFVISKDVESTFPHVGVSLIKPGSFLGYKQKVLSSLERLHFHLLQREEVSPEVLLRHIDREG
jgi:hypothetical protein